jgi:hypothetical protein
MTKMLQGHFRLHTIHAMHSATAPTAPPTKPVAASWDSTAVQNLIRHFGETTTPPTPLATFVSETRDDDPQELSETAEMRLFHSLESKQKAIVKHRKEMDQG